MKVFEILVLNHIEQVMYAAVDKLQFACKTGVGVDDTIIYLLHQ